MSKKLSKWLSKWLNECAYNHDCHDCKKGSECARAYLQIKSLIEAQAEPSEEWIKEKRREFIIELNKDYPMFSHKIVEDFIRNLLKEAPMRKPKVSIGMVSDFVDSEWKNYQNCHPESYEVKGMIIDYLKTIDVEVEGK